jgi:hypothetical protein
MRAALRSIHSPDAPHFPAYTPENPYHFGILIQALIGPEGGVGEESFDFQVCTASWLADQVPPSGFVFGRHYVVLQRFDASLITEALKDLCEQTTGSDWSAVAKQLARYGKWEFEDYQEL